MTHDKTAELTRRERIKLLEEFNISNKPCYFESVCPTIKQLKQELADANEKLKASIPKSKVQEAFDIICKGCDAKSFMGCKMCSVNMEKKKLLSDEGKGEKQ